MRFFYRRSGLTIEEFEKRPQEERNLALAKALQIDEASWPGQTLHTAEEHNDYKQAFARTGFTGGISWYRNVTRNWQTAENLTQTVPQPSLMVMAANDIVLRPSMADGTETYVPDLTKHLIEDCGHWTQSEKPAELNQAITSWLKKRFG